MIWALQTMLVQIKSTSEAVSEKVFEGGWNDWIGEGTGSMEGNI